MFWVVLNSFSLKIFMADERLDYQVVLAFFIKKKLKAMRLPIGAKPNIAGAFSYHIRSSQ